MSKISNLIFNGKKHYITSNYGPRAVISTSAGKTSTMHNGTDYGTNGLKIEQYAIENGYIFASAKATDGANYVWVIYPRVKLAMLHYHLDKYVVKTGQKVVKGTLLGYTGATGKATGVHLHLGIRDISKLTNAKINAMTWDALQSCAYVDPEKVTYSEYVAPTTTAKTYTVKKGDTLTAIAKAHGMKLDELLKLNPQIKNPNLINVGQTINLTANVITVKPTTPKVTTMQPAKAFKSGYGSGKRFTTKTTTPLLYGADQNKYGTITSLAKGTRVVWYGYYTNDYYYVAVGKRMGYVYKNNLQ